jgi:hypothetical protein
LEPAKSRNEVPKTGATAAVPGKGVNELRVKTGQKIISNPTNEMVFGR